VSVALPLYSLDGSLDAFSFDIIGAPGGQQNGVIAVDPSSWTFAAGETKRQLFDFVVGPFDSALGQFPPGSYTMRGAYGKHWSADAMLTLPP
jgi:hypothetical protein